MSDIRNVLNKSNTCVIVIIIFYDNRTTNPMKVFRGLSCALYTILENYFCIDYIYSEYKIIACYLDSRSVNEPYIMPWIHEGTKFNCHNIMPHSAGGILFRKRVCYS